MFGKLIFSLCNPQYPPAINILVTPPAGNLTYTPAHGRSMETSKRRGSLKPNVLKESVKLNWNFQRGGVGGGAQTKTKNLSREEDEY